MKQIISLLLVSAALFLSGCLDTTQEITLQADGSGQFTVRNDMGTLIAMAKQMGAGKELEKAGEQTIDSSFSLAGRADSIAGLSADERAVIRKGTASVLMNLKEEKFVTSIVFPFSNIAEVSSLNKLSSKILAETMKERMGGGATPPGTPEIPESSSIDDYYQVEFANGEITKKVNKDKYAKLADDEFLKGVKDAAAMGLEMKVSYVINLPRPASKAEGKQLTLSDDKKKVTISGTLEDFFEDPSLLEYKIKY